MKKSLIISAILFCMLQVVFGLEASSTSGCGLSILNNPFKYSGYYIDMESGMDYCMARYYMPESMTFITRDSICVPNRHDYCLDDPVEHSDETGHVPELIRKAAKFVWGCCCCGENDEYDSLHSVVPNNPDTNSGTIQLGTPEPAPNQIPSAHTLSRFNRMSREELENIFKQNEGVQCLAGEFGNVYKYGEFAFKFYKYDDAVMPGTITQATVNAARVRFLSDNAVNAYTTCADNSVLVTPIMETPLPEEYLAGLNEILWNLGLVMPDLAGRNGGMHDGLPRIFDTDCVYSMSRNSPYISLFPLMTSDIFVGYLNQNNPYLRGRRIDVVMPDSSVQLFQVPAS